MTGQDRERPLERDESVRLARIAIVCLLGALVVTFLLVAAGLPQLPLGIAGLVLVGALGAAVVGEQGAMARAAARHAASDAMLARMLRGLSRSTSADATVDAIVDELRDASGADHVVVARLKPAERIVEATLVSSSAAVPLSVTRFPASDLEPPPRMPGARRPAPLLHGLESGRRMTPVGPGRPARVESVAGVGAAAPAREEAAGWVVDAVADAGPASGGAGEGAAASGNAAGEAQVYAVERIADRVCRAYGLRHILAEPLLADGRVVGALVLSRRTDTGWSEGSRRVLQAAAQDLSAALERAYAHEDARARAATDALTGIPNRAYFEDLVEMLGRGRRANDALGILMLDLDHFKQLNDRYGHVVGDDVLRGVGRVLRASVRADDVPARYGGEEFVVVLRRATPETAVEIAERVRAAMRALDPVELGIDAPVTVSVGVAVGVADARSLVERADAALYRAKRRGRDRVEVG